MKEREKKKKKDGTGTNGVVGQALPVVQASYGAGSSPEGFAPTQLPDDGPGNHKSIFCPFAMVLPVLSKFSDHCTQEEDLEQILAPGFR